MGTIDEDEWCRELGKMPVLRSILAKDLDPETGLLRSFRTQEQNMAKCLANIDRLEFDQSKGKDVSAELASRRALVEKYRLNGIQPSAGLLVFAQLDKKKTRKVEMSSL